MKRIESITFYVAEHFMPALINQDWSGLETREMQTVEDFWNDAVAQCPDGFEWGHFSASTAPSEFRECEASEKLADCAEITAIYWSKKA